MVNMKAYNGLDRSSNTLSSLGAAQKQLLYGSLQIYSIPETTPIMAVYASPLDYFRYN